MKIGWQLQEARKKANLTQDQVASKIFVSRQTISNWENERSYPDILSVIMLSDLYGISLDALIKGDQKMIKHLADSTNIVQSNKKVIMAFLFNIAILVGIILLSTFISQQPILIFFFFSLGIINSAVLLYQLIKKI